MYWEFFTKRSPTKDPKTARLLAMNTITIATLIVLSIAGDPVVCSSRRS